MSILFKDAARYYEQEAHQVLAWDYLQDEVPDSIIEEFAKRYRTPIEAESENPLPVPYQSQNDNISGTGYRECFSSTMAMVAMYYGKVTNDDEYNKIRSKYGDTTSAEAQMDALKSLGLKPTFVTTASKQYIINEIDAGRPLAVGWLHKGPVQYPSGGGHWSLVIGYDDTGVWMNDPNGEANLVSGGYTPHLNGENLHYSYQNWLPRWTVEGPNSGWCMQVIP